MAKATNTKKSSEKRPEKVDALVRLRGTTPILFNPATDEVIENLVRRIKVQADTRSPAKQAQSKLITNDRGELVIPRRWVFACLREAGRGVDYKTRVKITSPTQGTKLPALLKLHGAEYVIHDGNGVPVTDWEVDKKKGTATQLGAKGGGIGIVRPRIDLPWFIDIPLTIYSKRIAPESVQQLIEIAGMEFGLGDGRPGKGKLDYGMFEIEKWEITGVEFAKEETKHTFAKALGMHLEANQ